MKSIILCADDYGQSTAISQAIIQLFQKNRLSATSCLATAPLWQTHAEWLKSLTTQPDIGLHFNLTEGQPLSRAMCDEGGENFSSLSNLLLKAYLRKLNFSAILAELNAQIDAFEAGMGRLPDYIDGHQHIHQFPIIRDVVLKVFDERLRQRPGCYIRCVNDQNIFFDLTSNAYLKKCIIQLCGASSFKKQLLQRKIPHNTSFSGIYDFKQAKYYPQLFILFLRHVQDNGLIMCHPGLRMQASDTDPIFYSRPMENDYFLSDDFLEACREQKVVLK